MSELKAFEVTGKALFGRYFTKKVYDKDEADKFISDLEESHKKEVGQLLIEIAELKEILKNSRNARKYWRKEYLIEYKECCSQKFKRCLAMYRYCSIKALYELDFKGNDVEWKWYSKWMHKWFKLANKFKEA